MVLIIILKQNLLLNQWCAWFWSNSNANAYKLPNPFLFFFFLIVCTHVPGSDLMGIFVADWQCKFWRRFWFVTKEKLNFVLKFWSASGVPTPLQFWYPKGSNQNFFLSFCKMLLGLSDSQINITI
jgi:hypothetical protein